MAITKTTVARNIEALHDALEARGDAAGYVPMRALAIALALELETFHEAETFLSRCGMSDTVQLALVDAWRKTHGDVRKGAR